jgi:hypothetical protein
MKTFKNRKTGALAYYKDGILNQDGCCVEIGFEPSSEYWEEVTKYQVLSVKTDDESISTLQNNGKYFIEDNPLRTKFDPNGFFCGTTLEQELADGSVIYSVKRLSDNVVFTVGDRAQTIGKYPHTISSIEIRQKNKNRDEKDGIDRIWLNWESGCGGNWLEDTEKVKTPILTTYDGVELFGGESIYGVTNDFQLCYVSMATKENVQRCKVFAKKENADEYIRTYKNYKTVDGKQIVEGDVFYLYDSVYYKCLYGSFGQFKSSKWDGKRYRTEEEVLQKIRTEKPQYSLNQVEKYLLKYLPLNTIYQSEIIGKMLKDLQNEQ